MAPSIMSCPSDQNTLQRIVTDALQTRSVNIEPIHGYLYRTYRLRTPQGFFYILKSRPSSHVRLLRHEEDRLQMESSVLHIIGSRSDSLCPRQIDHAHSKARRGALSLISGPFHGSILADIEDALSGHALARIDHSLGSYTRRLSSIRGSYFGPMHASKHHSSQSWGRTFATMLESVIRDGEDAMINLPYQGVRDLTRRHLASLDKVVDPRLTIIDLSACENVVVNKQTCQVTGLLDYSTAIWGDPFMSDAFYMPTSNFLAGYGKFANSDADQLIRQYLYVLYHSLLAIVRHFYRPSEDNDELEARRGLTTAMRQLQSAACR